MSKPTFAAVSTEEEAKNHMPWAGKICAVDGGFFGFHTHADFCSWKLEQEQEMFRRNPFYDRPMPD